MMFIKQISTNFNFKHHHYWHDIPAIKSMGTLKICQPLTILMGENGSGKSTLIEAIAVNYGMNAEGGGRNFNFATKATHSGLSDELRIGKLLVPDDTFFLRAEGFYNVATEIDELDKRSNVPLINSYGGKSLHEQSHGESFLALMKYRFRAGGLYILDEPEAALSPARLMEMIVLIHDLINNNCQFIIATHSPILMAYPGADVIMLDENGLRRVDYKETDHFIITQHFLNKPEQMMKYLLGNNIE